MGEFHKPRLGLGGAGRASEWYGPQESWALFQATLALRSDLGQVPCPPSASVSPSRWGRKKESGFPCAPFTSLPRAPPQVESGRTDGRHSRCAGKAECGEPSWPAPAASTRGSRRATGRQGHQSRCMAQGRCSLGTSALTVGATEEQWPKGGKL